MSMVSYQAICILTRNILCHKATPTTIDTAMTPSMEKLSDLTLIKPIVSIEVERRSLVNVYRISMQEDPHKYGGRHFFPRL